MLKHRTSKEIFTSDRIAKGTGILKTGLVYVVVNIQRSKGIEAPSRLRTEGELSPQNLHLQRLLKKIWPTVAVCKYKCTQCASAGVH